MFVTHLIWLFVLLVMLQLLEILFTMSKVCCTHLLLIYKFYLLDGPKAAEIRARKMNRGWMQRNKVGPDGFLQLSLQLASYRLTGN